jgi:two-component system alkaline phosphatase synthesis response regulator PhoP
MSKRVIIVEDDAAFRTIIRFNLEQAGLEVVVASDGLDGWRRLELEPVDLVVTDWQMPGMNGVELCWRMQRDPQLAAMPVIMVTAKGIGLDEKRLRAELGVVQLMSKPFSPQELVRAVQDRLHEVERRRIAGEIVRQPG